MAPYFLLLKSQPNEIKFLCMRERSRDKIRLELFIKHDLPVLEKQIIEYIRKEQ